MTSKPLSQFTLYEIAVRYQTALMCRESSWREDTAAPWREGEGYSRTVRECLIMGLQTDYNGMSKEKVFEMATFIEIFGKALDAFADESY